MNAITGVVVPGSVSPHIHDVRPLLWRAADAITMAYKLRGGVCDLVPLRLGQRYQLLLVVPNLRGHRCPSGDHWRGHGCPEDCSIIEPDIAVGGIKIGCRLLEHSEGITGVNRITGKGLTPDLSCGLISRVIGLVTEVGGVRGHPQHELCCEVWILRVVGDRPGGSAQRAGIWLTVSRPLEGWGYAELMIVGFVEATLEQEIAHPESAKKHQNLIIVAQRGHPWVEIASFGGEDTGWDQSIQQAGHARALGVGKIRVERITDHLVDGALPSPVVFIEWEGIGELTNDIAGVFLGNLQPKRLIFLPGQIG